MTARGWGEFLGGSISVEGGGDCVISVRSGGWVGSVDGVGAAGGSLSAE